MHQASQTCWQLLQIIAKPGAIKWAVLPKIFFLTWTQMKNGCGSSVCENIAGVWQKRHCVSFPMGEASMRGARLQPIGALFLVDFFPKLLIHWMIASPEETNILKWKLKCVSRGSVGSDSFEYFSGSYVESLPSFPKISDPKFHHNICVHESFLCFFQFSQNQHIIYNIFIYNIYETTLQQNLSSSCFPNLFWGKHFHAPPFPRSRFRGPSSMEPSMSYSEEEPCATSVPPQRVAPPQHREEEPAAEWCDGMWRERSLEVNFFPMKFMILWDIIGGFSMNIWDFPGCYGILWDIFSWRNGWYFFNLGIWMWMDGSFGNDGGWGRYIWGVFLNELLSFFLRHEKERTKIIPSMELSYPTLGKGNSSSKNALVGDIC